MELVKVLKSSGCVFVPFCMVAAFLNGCKQESIIVFGGAYDTDVCGQYFYMENSINI